MVARRSQEGMDVSRSALAVSRLPRAAHEPTPTAPARLLGIGTSRHHQACWGSYTAAQLATHLLEQKTDIRIIQVLFETTTNCPRTPDRGADLLFVPSPVRRDRTDSQAIRLSRRRARRHSSAGRVERLHTGVDDARGSGALQAMC